ncbi:hypothetical protein LGL55_08395 [Clostridium tagluense]|uniref:hypothetical protein n=1 Tax=Clostridium tagluense TaxID=360422 RepID=UPI001CF30388|nr:hypothetical protein [Clostridium tagluense]MCB2311271.1 hypothetical protein [Clostridium tagluense]MCB2316087.1 hypothetical protein [Clostridium tagluense]MCB2320847.1 hypothetical protein [Clostridium tagluense]MCB2325956.1 hypothetical protein [Clostridium tagluense]MCB2330587.1 hypothetical protein [Clostridium tagluense]
MKLNKTTTTIISFALGTVMFTTTAIAQVLSKSGYDQLKDSVKYTAENCTTKLSSYTMDTSVSLKDNGTVIYSENSLNKVDVSNGTEESVSNRVEGSTKSGNYNYFDKKGSISKYNEENVYHTTEYTSPRESGASKNPFKEQRADDMEKIADALVGNLKDAVVVTENSDGTKTLSGSLSEAQIPALVNAVVSFQSKNEFGNRSNNPNDDSNMPKITKDVFVKEVKGNMVTTKEGFIQNVLGSGVISGKDDSGKDHKLTFELLVKMTGINSTKVSKPDLTGKKVEKNIEQDHSKLSNPEKYIGKYKSDILMEKDAKFVKIGERFIDVTAVNEKSISGRHYEEYAKGYEEYAKNKKDFKFDTKFDKEQFGGEFNVTSASKENVKGHISIIQDSAKIYFNTGENISGNIINDDQYSKVFN